KSAKALAAFIGVTPRQKQSGTSVNGRTTISRAGHSAARKALYMPGLVAKHHNPVIVAMAKRLASRGMSLKAIVGASMRRLGGPDNGRQKEPGRVGHRRHQPCLWLRLAGPLHRLT